MTHKITTFIHDPDMATRVSIPAMATLVATAFHDLPPSRWLVGRDERRHAALTANFEQWIGHAIDHGSVHLASTRRDDEASIIGVAVWLDMTFGPLTDPPGYSQHLNDLGELASRFRAFDDTLAAHHDQEPHQHLALLAVHPEHQGRGVGGVLLAQHHATLDVLGHSATLHASTDRAAALYARYGYTAGTPFPLPDHGTEMIPMHRNAQTTTATTSAGMP